MPESTDDKLPDTVPADLEMLKRELDRLVGKKEGTPRDQPAQIAEES